MPPERTPQRTPVVSGPGHTVLPMYTEAIFDSIRQPVVWQAAPNTFVHPINVLREYLATNIVDGSWIGGLVESLRCPARRYPNATRVLSSRFRVRVQTDWLGTNRVLVHNKSGSW